MKLKKELEFVKKIIRETGKILLEKRDDLDVKMKGVNDYVSNADYAASDFLQKNLFSEFPAYGILDEESEVDGRDKEYCWVIDPLDGTWGYIKGYDDFAVLIGLLKNGKPVMGVIYRPVEDDLIWAVKGEGAFFEDGRQLKVKNGIFNDILVSKERENPFFESLKEKGFGPIKMPTSYKINAVARGKHTSFICHPNVFMGLWDLCAHQIILEEAGGIMTNVHGKPIDYLGERKNKLGVIATNPEMLEELLKIFK